MFIYLTSLLHLEATDMDYIQESNVSELGDKLIIKLHSELTSNLKKYNISENDKIWCILENISFFDKIKNEEGLYYLEIPSELVKKYQIKNKSNKSLRIIMNAYIDTVFIYRMEISDTYYYSFDILSSFPNISNFKQDTDKFVLYISSLLEAFEFLISFKNGIEYLLDQMHAGEFMISKKGENKYILDYLGEKFGRKNPLQVDFAFESEEERILGHADRRNMIDLPPENTYEIKYKPEIGKGPAEDGKYHLLFYYQDENQKTFTTYIDCIKFLLSLPRGEEIVFKHIPGYSGYGYNAEFNNWNRDEFFLY